MIAKIIDGRALAEQIGRELKKEVDALLSKNVIPCLRVILIGNNPASEIYVRNKKKKASELGIDLEVISLAAQVSEDEIENIIIDLNQDENVHAILIQTPLPTHFSTREILNYVDPAKDVDCFTDSNLGKLFTGDLSFMPCTARGVLTMLEAEKVDLIGMKALMVGCSVTVGNPLAQVLLHRKATVTIAHSETSNLPELCLKHDLIISAVGQENLIREVKNNAVVIDIGINRTAEGKIVGDCDFENLLQNVQKISPVPGGVGPMTVISLMQNTILLCKRLLLKH